MTKPTIWQRAVATLKHIAMIPIMALLWIFAQLLGLFAKLKGY